MTIDTAPVLRVEQNVGATWLCPASMTEAVVAVRSSGRGTALSRSTLTLKPGLLGILMRASATPGTRGMGAGARRVFEVRRQIRSAHLQIDRAGAEFRIDWTISAGRNEKVARKASGNCSRSSSRTRRRSVNRFSEI